MFSLPYHENVQLAYLSSMATKIQSLMRGWRDRVSLARQRFVEEVRSRLPEGLLFSSKR